MIIYGWGKDLKEVAYAGIEKCPNCKNWSHFYICEHSSHASLYFIKVVRWNKKWLCLCKKCKNGCEIEEKKKDDIVRQTVSLPSHEHCVLMWSRFDQAVSQAFDLAQASGPEAVRASVRKAIVDTFASIKQTFQEDHAQYVAQRFVASLQDQDRPK